MDKHTKLQIEIEICSEAIFTSGEKERNLVQSRAQTDAYGFVYFHSKTLKGQLKKQALWLLKQYISIDKQQQTHYADSFYKSIITMFGTNDIERNIIIKEYKETLVQNNKTQKQGLMKLSNLELNKDLRDYFISLQKQDEANGYYRISAHDLIEAQTHIRTGIQLENGTVKDHMFNTYHTIRKDLTFYSTVIFEEALTERKREEALDYGSLIGDLSKIIHSFRRIGAGIHRGRGEIKASLLVGEDRIPYNLIMEAGE